MTKKEAFKWGAEAQQSFETLKRVMTTTPANFSKPFAIECDASGAGVGAVLMQDGRLLAYFIKAISSKHLSKSIYEKELMAVVLAIQHWRYYLMGRAFEVHTNQRSLKDLLTQRVITHDQ